MQQNNAKAAPKNKLFDVINKFTDKEKQTMAGITVDAMKLMLRDPRMSQEAINKSKDLIYLSVCSAYVYGVRNTIAELDKLKKN